jgi:hypothetical protein
MSRAGSDDLSITWSKPRTGQRRDIIAGFKETGSDGPTMNVGSAVVGDELGFLKTKLDI